MYKKCIEKKAGSYNKSVKPHDLKKLKCSEYISATCTVKHFRKNAIVKKHWII